MQAQPFRRLRQFAFAAAIALPACAPQVETIIIRPRMQELGRKPAPHFMAEVAQPGNPEAEELVRALADKSQPMVLRIAIARKLGTIKHAGAAPALAAVLGDRNQELRDAAVISLGRMRYMGAWLDLFGMLKNDPSGYVRWDAAVALGEIKSRKSVEPLMELLSTEEAETRKCAALALGEIRAPKSAGALIKALEDPDQGVEIQAARALGKLGDAGALPALRELEKRSRGNVRAAAREAAEEIGNNKDY